MSNSSLRELMITQIKNLIDEHNSKPSGELSELCFEPYLNYESMSDEALLDEYTKWIKEIKS